MPEATSRFRISNAVRRTQTDDGAILLDVRYGRMFSLNPIGASILELLDSGFDETQVAERISEACAMSTQAVRADVHDFIEVLYKHNLLQVQNRTSCSANENP